MASADKGRGEIPVFSREAPRIREEIASSAANIDFDGDVVILRNPLNRSEHISRNVKASHKSRIISHHMKTFDRD